MIVIDEHFPESQRQLLKGWRIRFRQIGYEIGRRGLKDSEIIPLLLQQRRLTFFTLDSDFDKSKYCHSHYSLVFLDINEYEAATFIRRFLKQRKFNTQAKRLGKIFRVTRTCISVRERHSEQGVRFEWTD
ncbi:hypothetical protein GWO43_16420 [candidate division KSB1 bacterium]|nr:hypothetical protein [candidate division KSB1 bacterium]NIR68718.1 hypothetical protein [candidate division KSB1 bacterium]NIS25535.1 hypothetical protein [candidate division KSB1 bacterium]NIT72428.1 hypothetical protein [candidate division KSB1 bacterium]NIU26212.1 hypothetical protein [candidate division KSB1 bacterium]